MKVIITGVTGMVGKSVLLECLKNDQVEKVLAVTRSALDLEDPKLEQLIHADFLDLSAVNAPLSGYDAIFHCMGISVVGKTEEEYSKFTFDLTAHWADTLYDLNPQMVFSYVSGTGSDSSEKGRVMWARVKGRAENYVLNKGFKDAYAVRLGGLIPAPGIRSRTGWINTLITVFRPFFGLMKNMKSMTTSENIGKAMINSARFPQEKKHLQNPDINALAKAHE